MSLGQKVGHLASVCRSKQPADRRDKDTISGQRIGSVQETVDSNDDYSSDSSGYLHNILQLGTRANKFLLTVDINSIPIEMEVDSGAERSTVPLSLFEQRLSGVCKLKPSRVSLYQYDKSPLTIAGESQATVRINSRVISAVFVVVDVQKQFPLLGRDWMALLNFDLISLMTQATAIHQTTADVVKNDLMEEFAEVFQNELGVLRGIEATVAVNESAAPRFHKARPVPFALKEKVERQLQQQVLEGELAEAIGQHQLSWYIRRMGASGFVVISRSPSTPFYNLRHTPCPPRRRCLVPWPMVSPILNLT